jgi:hypothetical protein
MLPPQLSDWCPFPSPHYKALRPLPRHHRKFGSGTVTASATRLPGLQHCETKTPLAELLSGWLQAMPGAPHRDTLLTLLLC